jgi:hypothetical protein
MGMENSPLENIVTMCVRWERGTVHESGSPATIKDPEVGDKVVVRADVSNNKLVANEAQFGANAKQSMQGMEGMDHK